MYRRARTGPLEYFFYREGVCHSERKEGHSRFLPDITPNIFRLRSAPSIHNSSPSSCSSIQCHPATPIPQNRPIGSHRSTYRRFRPRDPTEPRLYSPQRHGSTLIRVLLLGTNLWLHPSYHVYRRARTGLLKFRTGSHPETPLPNHRSGYPTHKFEYIHHWLFHDRSGCSFAGTWYWCRCRL